MFCLLLLVANEVLNHGSLGHVLVVLVVEELLLLHLLFFRVAHVLLHFLAVGSFIVLDLLLLLLFLCLM